MTLQTPVKSDTLVILGKGTNKRLYNCPFNYFNRTSNKEETTDIEI